MSSTYGGLANTYESLVDGRHGWPGAGTRSGQEQYIEAEFPFDVYPSKVILSQPRHGVFQEQGWPTEGNYLHEGMAIEIPFETAAGPSTGGAGNYRAAADEKGRTRWKTVVVVHNTTRNSTKSNIDNSGVDAACSHMKCETSIDSATTTRHKALSVAEEEEEDTDTEAKQNEEEEEEEFIFPAVVILKIKH